MEEFNLYNNKDMTQEDKQLLLQDLCTRLPYKVIVDYRYNTFNIHNENNVKHGSKCILNCYLLDIFMSPRQNEKGEYIKPYLRPLSSMTEEEKEELLAKLPTKWNIEIDKFEDFYFDICEECAPDIELFTDIIDWLNKKMFDYRGLIPKGLAISTEVILINNDTRR